METRRTDASALLARQVREQFVAYAQGGLIPLAEAIRSHLNDLALSAPELSERQACRELLDSFEAARVAWVQTTASAWSAAALVDRSQRRQRGDTAVLELMGHDVFEQKILASRLAHAISERGSGEFSNLRLRLLRIEGVDELAPEDVLRPEAAAQLLVERWMGVGLTQQTWLKAHDLIRQHMAERLFGACQRSNAFLIAQGVLPEIDPAERLKRGAGRTGHSGGSLESAGAALTSDGDSRSHSGAAPAARSKPDGVVEETRLMTGATPLARARTRASGVFGQLKRMLAERIGSPDSERQPGPSPALAAALAEDDSRAQAQQATRLEDMDGAGGSARHDRATVAQLAGELRERSSEIKARASTSAEKATIEIVALMFQSILAEERIPPAVRVWFARLQMPVLRVAIAEPEFFGSMEHPARQLIDRLGSCVMGFDAINIGGSALANEIKRVVQVIEQYPETGRRVFQLVYDEFQKFLSHYLTEKGSTQRLVSVAQQVEQKETLAIQYTIEMRNTLNNIPVRDEVREFLFKVWAEVLAIAAVKHGPQHPDTIVLKKCAVDLVWAASAKPQRSDRARVIQDLPALLQRLRQGMTLLSLPASVQEAHIKVLGDTLADAFQSKTEPIAQPLIESLSQRLAHLEDFLADDPAADLSLDEQSIELLLGIDASAIEVVADDGARASAAMLAWALELQLGNWFTLDHNSRTSQVQYVWCSQRKQLHLFATPDGKSFLVQLQRLASYLQAGLLLPAEEETLTVRATRDALARLTAEPDLLLV